MLPTYLQMGPDIHPYTGIFRGPATGLAPRRVLGIRDERPRSSPQGAHLQVEKTNYYHVGNVCRMGLVMGHVRIQRATVPAWGRREDAPVGGGT